MKIVDRATFLSMPQNTVFAKYEPSVFGPIEIKGETWGNDFLTQQIVDAIDSDGTSDFMAKLDDAQANGTSLKMDFYCLGRDGCFDDGQLFAIFEKVDVMALIERLKESV